MFATIQRLIDQEAKLVIPAANLTPRANLYDLGLTSFDAIRVLVAVERAFKIEFPREMLNRESASSIEAIAKAAQAMRQAPVVEAAQGRVTHRRNLAKPILFSTRRNLPVARHEVQLLGRVIRQRALCRGEIFLQVPD